MVSLVEPVSLPTPAERLAARLDDPAVANALNELLDHADLLAVVVTGLSEFVSRGDTMTDTISTALKEVRDAAAHSSTVDLDALKHLASQGKALIPKINEKLPTLERALEPGPNGVDLVELGAMVARATGQATADSEVGGIKVKGALSLVRAMKDEDVNRAIAFGLSVAKALGVELRATDTKGGAHRRPSPVPRP